MPNDPLARYHFADDHGHPLGNCIEYRNLLAENERLRSIGCVPFSIHKAPPPGWKYLGRMPIGEAYQHKATSLTVISSIDTIENENGTSKVLHVSVSRKSRLPSWDDLKRAKNTFIGLDVDAYHVIPKADDHVNLHNYCMHLWSEWNEKMGGIHAR